MADAALEGASAYNTRAAGLAAEQDNWRKQKAMNALTNIYGPIAGAPVEAMQNQNYLTATQQDPLRTEALRLNNVGTGTANDQAAENLGFSRQQHPLQLQQDQNTVAGGVISNAQAGENLDLSKRLDPLKVQAQGIANQGGTIANQGGEIANATGADQLRAAQAARDRATAQGLLGALSTAFNNGDDIGATFDHLAPQIAALEGVDPNHMQPLRAAFVADPQGTITKLNAALTQANPTPTAGGRAAAAANTPQARAQQADALEVIQARTAAVPTTIDQASALISKMSPSAIIRKARAQIPGTPEYQFEALAHSISSNLSLDDLRSLRTSGLSLGRTNIAEFTASAQAFGNLDLGQDPGQIKSVLDRLSGTYKQINSNLGADVTRLRTGAASTPGKPTGGVSYPAVTNFLQYALPGVVISSEGRTPAKNTAVGGVQGSLHTRVDSGGQMGEAIDFVPKGNQWQQADLDKFAAQLDARGIPHSELMIEKDAKHGYHVHWGWGAKPGKAGATSAPLSDADLLKKYGL